MLKKKLMNKVGIATQQVAAAFCGLEKGDRIMTVEEMSRQFNASRGTIQTTLSFLQQEGAIKLQPRGSLGTFITDLNLSLLLDICDMNSLVGVMPLPYSKRYEGLATGISTSMNKGKMRTSLVFSRGADNRLEGILEQRYDFAVVSRLAAEHYVEKQYPIVIAHNFGPHTYVDQHALVTCRNGVNLKAQDFSNCRIGVDEASTDQRILSHRFFRDTQVTYVPIVYNQVIPALKGNDIDATIWNADALDARKNGIFSFPLEQISQDDTEAAIIHLAGKPFISRILAELLNPDEVLEYQKKVMAGACMPQY
ncbi:GntR family transcriptional regulator YhfZ [Parasphaerochaeta coccoides]|uniref:GntR family transcriptional regulator YhfZ n=1 Tax=Parasphaerochaeta coccoides TaxID=273376 RepID=UPI000691EE28|nr:GntR family transcriptional regulator YhfZ [Parasphaerochaeta coccoides]